MRHIQNVYSVKREQIQCENLICCDIDIFCSKSISTYGTCQNFAGRDMQRCLQVDTSDVFLFVAQRLFFF